MRFVEVVISLLGAVVTAMAQSLEVTEINSTQRFPSPA